MALYFVQMSGVPGSGKSTVARALAPELDAVVLDHDVTKSALLAAGIAEDESGPASYLVLGALSESTLAQGHSVILDSPCLYDDLLRRGIDTASKYSAAYRYVECQLADTEQLNERLLARERRRSQLQHLDQSFSHAGAAPVPARDLIAQWAVAVKRPSSSSLTVDTSQSLDSCMERVMAYVVAG